MLEQWRLERPDLDASPIADIGRLSRVSQFVTEDLVALYRQFGLSEGEFDILATLRRVGAPYALAPSALVGITMVTKGARVVRLTDAGLALIDDAVAAHLENERRILEPLPAADRAALERILSAWASHYEARA